MGIKFCDGHLKLERFVRAVYKLLFNEKWYYIGSSVDLKRRIGQWKTRLQKPGFKKNASIKFLLPEIESVRFEVLELVPDEIWIKERESHYLKDCFNDDLCLNITPDTVNGKGRKLALGKTPKPPKNKPTPKKPIAQFDVSGNLIAIHESILAASRVIKIKTDAISHHLNGRKYKTVKGFILKLVAEDGSFIEHATYSDKIPLGRKFYQIDKEGNIVAEYYNKATAARALKTDRKRIERTLNNEPRYKTVRGYIFKYA